jgi:hypothetical protein
MEVFKAGSALALTLLTACASSPTVTQTPPTAAPLPTAAPTLTPLVLPTATLVVRTPAPAVVIVATARPAPSNTPRPAATAIPSAAPTPVAPLEFRPAAIEEKNAKLRYEINGALPTLPAGRRGAREFNQFARTTIEREIGSFRRDMQSWNPAIGNGQGSYFEVGYEVDTLTEDFASLLVHYGYYYAGAAHPNSHARAINFDLARGRPVAMDALFASKDRDYLKVISDESAKQLSKTLGDAFDADNVAPKAKTFENWTITRNGLRIYFAPYEVAAYAAGPQEVLIPKSAFGRQLEAGGALNRFAK